MGMAKSKIGYVNDEYGNDSAGRGTPSRIPIYGWNPGGFGCSGGCQCCWARKLAARTDVARCPDCKAFRVHMHPKRLDWPAKTKKPGVVLVNFTCDTWDPTRKISQSDAMLTAAGHAPQHTYVWLTQNPEALRTHVAHYLTDREANWYFGVTIRTQAEAKEGLPVFLDMPGNLWISAEPLWEAVDFGFWWDAKSTKVRMTCTDIKGIIVGHDKRKKDPSTKSLDHIRSVVDQCKAAGVNCYVKQIHHNGKFLRASHPNEYALYPADLKQRDLPWDGAIKEGKDG